MVHPDRGFGILPGECRFEFPEIRGQPVGIQSEVVAGAEHRVVAQRGAKDVERVAQEVPGLIGAALRARRQASTLSRLIGRGCSIARRARRATRCRSAARPATGPSGPSSEAFPNSRRVNIARSYETRHRRDTTTTGGS